MAIFSFLLLEKMNRGEYRKATSKRIFKLLLNYWVILILFTCIGLVFDKDGIIPGSIWKFIGNFTLLKISYNGAWWFMLIYMVLTALSGVLHTVCKRCNSVLCVGVFGVIYFVAYLVRFGKLVLPYENVVWKWLVEELALLGTSLLPYVVGMLFYKLKIVSRVREWMGKVAFPVRGIIVMAACAVCIILHGFVQTLFIAPFLAIVTVLCVAILSNGTAKGAVSKFFVFMGEHSLNIWLVHMFFYFVIFKDFIFKFRYPAVILPAMLAICVGVSMAVKWVMRRLEKAIAFTGNRINKI